MKKHLHNIPSGFAVYESDGSQLVYNTGLISGQTAIKYLESFPDLISELDGMCSRAKGMETVWELPPLKDCHYHVVARQYVHGGFFGDCLGQLRTLFIDPGPMIKELQVYKHIKSKGIATLEPLALYLKSGAGPFFSAIIFSKKVLNSINLHQLCCMSREDKLEFSEKQKKALLIEIADSVAKMHDAGVYHGDLNLRNILVIMPQGRQKGRDIVHLIDFKKAEFEDEISLSRGESNLARLWRSICKRPAASSFFNQADYDFMIQRYRKVRRAGNLKR